MEHGLSQLNGGETDNEQVEGGKDVARLPAGNEQLREEFNKGSTVAPLCSWALYLKMEPTTEKNGQEVRARDIAQLVALLLGKHEALSSVPSTA